METATNQNMLEFRLGLVQIWHMQRAVLKRGRQETHVVAVQGFDTVEAIELDEEGVGVGQDMRMILWKERLQDLDFILPPRHITHTHQSYGDARAHRLILMPQH